jgi:hypothetical protein
MSHSRFRIVFILLVLILLIVSTLFGVLTYWLEPESLPGHFLTPSSKEGGRTFRLHPMGKGSSLRICSDRSLSDGIDRINLHSGRMA